MKLNSLFTDHAVLQHGISVPVWGSTLPNAKVSGQIAGIKTWAIASASGDFMLRFPPLPVGGPYTLEISTGNKRESARVEDVWVGEVWICSGQSNMEFSLAAGLPDPEPKDCDGVRMITVARQAAFGRQRDFKGAWAVGTLENAAAFSGVGYFFARRLHDELKMPVGMIHTSWGGTRAEAWTSREALMEHPATAQMVRDYESDLACEDHWTGAAREQSLPADPGNAGARHGWAKPDFDDAAWGEVELPGSFAKCCGRKTNGAFWFRKTVDVPAAWRGRKLELRIGAADKHDVTYFNGVKVGATGKGVEDQHWNVPRQYAVPAQANGAPKATVAVRVWSYLFDGGLIGPAQAMRLGPADDPAASIPLGGTWKWVIESDIGLTPMPPALPMLPGNANAPYTLYDAMINPLLPYAIRGAIWYQGESNAGNAKDYLRLQCGMVADWRRAWGQGDFPFICVQLANYQPPKAYDPDSTWAVVRQAQLDSTRLCPNVGMASAVDIGDELDIHPKNKRDVGRRLAQWALAKTYGRNLVPNGPHYSRYAVEGGAIRIFFTDVGKGLVTKGGKGAKGAVATCVVAGADRKFVPAQARVEGDTLVVSAPDVPAPRAVRYAWSDNPAGCNLYNADGLPASPFRTDAW